MGSTGLANYIDGFVSSVQVTAFNVDLGNNYLEVSGIPGLGTITFAVENFVDVRGTANADTIIGNAAANRLSGGGGLDFLTGGGGSDSFIFNQALISANRSTITDFTHGVDRIELGSNVFGSLHATSGVLNNNEFHIGAAALTINDHIIYNSISGALSYDADGSGAGVAIQFATLSAGLNTITNTDFRVV